MVLTLSLPEFCHLAKLRGGDSVEAANAALALLRIAHAEPSSQLRIAVHAHTLGPFIAACTYLGVPLGLCAVSVAQGELQLYLASEMASSLVWARPAAWLARALPLLPAALLYLRQF